MVVIFICFTEFHSMVSAIATNFAYTLLTRHAGKTCQ